MAAKKKQKQLLSVLILGLIVIAIAAVTYLVAYGDIFENRTKASNFQDKTLRLWEFQKGKENWKADKDISNKIINNPNATPSSIWLISGNENKNNPITISQPNNINLPNDAILLKIVVAVSPQSSIDSFTITPSFNTNLKAVQTDLVLSGVPNGLYSEYVIDISKIFASPPNPLTKLSKISLSFVGISKDKSKRSLKEIKIDNITLFSRITLTPPTPTPSLTICSEGIKGPVAFQTDPNPCPSGQHNYASFNCYDNSYHRVGDGTCQTAEALISLAKQTCEGRDSCNPIPTSIPTPTPTLN